MTAEAPVTRVLGAARRYSGWVVGSMLCMAVVAATTIFVYNLVRPLYDQLLAPEAAAGSVAADRSALVASLDELTRSATERLSRPFGDNRRALLVLVLIGIVVKNLFAFAARTMAARFGLATIRDLRVMLFDALLGQSPEYFQRHPSGVIMSRVVHDVDLVREALGERFGDLLQDLLTVLALLVYVFALNLQLALATVVAAPLMLAPVVVLSRRLRRRSRQSQESMGELSSVLGETVGGMTVVQAFGMQELQLKRFRDRTERHFLARLRSQAIQAANAPAMEVVGTVAALLVIAYASREIAGGRMSLGDFSAFLVGVWGAYNPLKRLNKFNLAAQQAAVAAERVFEVVDAPVTLPEPVDPVHELDPGAGLALEDVSFAYGGESWVLRGLDLRIAAGECVALVGASGAGKTTVAQLVPRFWDVARGRVVVGGVDVRRVPSALLRAHIGLVTQETVLFDDSVAANIAAGKSPLHRERIEAAARAAQAHDFVCALPQGYATVLDGGGAGLSGGERQRLAIARALYKDSPFLILDEATSALDPESERMLGEALRRLIAHRTTLLIAHRLSTVRLADRIAVLAHGRIVEQGTHDQLMAVGGAYRRMVDAGTPEVLSG